LSIVAKPKQARAIIQYLFIVLLNFKRFGFYTKIVKNRAKFQVTTANIKVGLKKERTGYYPKNTP
jgi:hypothetical protein